MSARQVARLEAAAAAEHDDDHETGDTSSEEEVPPQRTFNAFAVSARGAGERSRACGVCACVRTTQLRTRTRVDTVCIMLLV